MANDVTQLQHDAELDLIRRAIAKEEEACRILVSYYEPRLTSYVAHMIGDGEAARDIVQDVFSTCFSTLHRWRPPSSFFPHLPGSVFGSQHTAPSASAEHPLSPWLYKISTHKALNWLRQEARSRMVSTDQPLNTVSASMTSMTMTLPASSAGAPEDAIIAREVLQLTLSRVAPLDAACVVLRFIEEESYAAIAARLGLTIEAARKRVARALPVLRRNYLQVVAEEEWTMAKAPERKKNRGR